jgi:molybdopterin-biosynthesis enzyme MoeA-like protein
MRDVAAEQGLPFEPERADNLHRLNMGMFPAGASLIPNPYNKIPGFSVASVHFLPGFPVMAWPMIEWVLDTLYRSLHGRRVQPERSVGVYGSLEATLTPLMEEVERRFAGVRVFSLPCVDEQHAHGRHIELGVKGPAGLMDDAFVVLHQGLDALSARCGPELVR